MQFLSALNTDNVMKALDIFWKGMLAVIIVIAVIYLVVVIMNVCGKKAAERKARLMAEAKQKDEDPPQA